MSNENSKNEKDIIVNNDTPIGNDKSTIDDVKKCFSAPNFQVESKDPESTGEQQDSISSSNTPAENTKPDIHTTEEDSRSVLEPSDDNKDIDPSHQQQEVHSVKNILLQIWHCVEGLIKVFTFCIVAYTLLITKKQVSIMQDQAGVMQDQIKEMQKDRNESYKAVITANPVQENLLLTCYARAEDGRTKYDHLLTNFEKLDNMEDYRITDISVSEKQTFTKIQFANIGPGIATRVKFTWDNKNIDNLYQILRKYDKNAYEYLRGDNDYFYFNPYGLDPSSRKGSKFVTTLDSVDYSYMLSNRAETYIVELPIIYSVLFTEIFVHEPNHVDLEKPSVNLIVEFSDTQGIEYSETITMTVSNVSVFINGTLNGHVSYTITPSYSDPVQKQ